MHADKHKLQRVLANLLSNALRHTPAKGTVSVNIELSHDASEVLFSVRDTGPGIPPTEAERVFERFYRIDGSRNRESGGSGLGLAISREIVSAHGGSISVDTSCSDGARIVFSIPLQRG